MSMTQIFIATKYGKFLSCFTSQRYTSHNNLISLQYPIGNF